MITRNWFFRINWVVHVQDRIKFKPWKPGIQTGGPSKLLVSFFSEAPHYLLIREVPITCIGHSTSPFPPTVTVQMRMRANVSYRSWRLLGFNWINMQIKHLLLYTFHWPFLDLRLKTKSFTWATNPCKIWCLSTPPAPFPTISSSPTKFQVFWSFSASCLQGHLPINIFHTCGSLGMEPSSSTFAWLTPSILYVCFSGLTRW